MSSVQNPADFPAYWADCVNRGAVDELVALYHAKSVLMPTFSPHAAKNSEQVRAYFEQLASRAGLGVSLHEGTVDCLPTGGAISGWHGKKAACVSEERNVARLFCGSASYKG